MTVTDQPTDHATQSVTICHIYVRSTAMRPSNYSSSNNLIYNVHNVKKISNLKRRQLPGGERRIVSIIDELSKDVRIKPTLLQKH